MFITCSCYMLRWNSFHEQKVVCFLVPGIPFEARSWLYIVQREKLISIRDFHAVDTHTIYHVYTFPLKLHVRWGSTSGSWPPGLMQSHNVLPTTPAIFSHTGSLLMRKNLSFCNHSIRKSEPGVQEDLLDFICSFFSTLTGPLIGSRRLWQVKKK